jgi:hypothetical protein
MGSASDAMPYHSLGRMGIVLPAQVMKRCGSGGPFGTLRAGSSFVRATQIVALKNGLP